MFFRARVDGQDFWDIIEAEDLPKAKELATDFYGPEYKLCAVTNVWPLTPFEVQNANVIRRGSYNGD